MDLTTPQPGETQEQANKRVLREMLLSGQPLPPKGTPLGDWARRVGSIDISNPVAWCIVNCPWSDNYAVTLRARSDAKSPKMTKRELIAELAEMPDDGIVLIQPGDDCDLFDIVVVQIVRSGDPDAFAVLHADCDDD